MQYEIVKDPTLLRAMRRAGIVKFTGQTLKKIKNLFIFAFTKTNNNG